MCNGILGQFDTSPSVLLDYIASKIWLALVTSNDYSIVTTLDDRILPHYGCTHLRFVSACNGDTSLMGTFNQIVNDQRLIVEYFDANLVQLHYIQ